jgi:hypothetical protein
MTTPQQNRQARAAMKARLRTESELEQLIIDHFSEVRQLIPTGVDRLSIENRLLEVVGANAILRALLGPRHHLTRLAPALRLLALILTGVVAMCFMLSLSGTADRPGWQTDPRPHNQGMNSPPQRRLNSIAPPAYPLSTLRSRRHQRSTQDSLPAGGLLPGPVRSFTCGSHCKFLTATS